MLSNLAVSAISDYSRPLLAGWHYESSLACVACNNSLHTQTNTTAKLRRTRIHRQMWITRATTLSQTTTSPDTDTEQNYSTGLETEESTYVPDGADYK